MQKKKVFRASKFFEEMIQFQNFIEEWIWKKAWNYPHEVMVKSP